MSETGTLYLVGTPIGNLQDVTLRALDTLRAVDVIACEDTRRTRALLTRFEIQKPLLAVPSHDERRRARTVAERLEAGASVAFVTDAGMPAVSDPGTEVVRAALAVGAPVVPIPGPSAALTALAASGLGEGTFHFVGFLPRKGPDRRRLVAAMSTWPGTLVLLEAPGRLGGTLADLAEVLGQDRPAAVCRELTKLHEEVARGTLGSLGERFAEGARGEITLVVGPGVVDAEAPPDPETIHDEVEALVAGGLRLKAACKAVAERHGLSARDVYQAELAWKP